MFLILLAPSANRVYAGAADRLVAAELAVVLGRTTDHPISVRPTTLAGVGYLELGLEELDEATLAGLGQVSGLLALFRRVPGPGPDADYLVPVPVPRPDLFDDDLVTIPKYPGKTNEQFTRLLMNVTLAASNRPVGPAAILDPLCGRGTTLSTGLILGHDVYGVEADLKDLESYAAFLRTYFRRKRVRHSVSMTPVRREGRSLGRRLELEVTPAGRATPLRLTAFSGDARSSAALYGRRRFDAIVTDAPYGVVHASESEVAGRAARHRSAGGLLIEGIGVWAGQLKAGGALGISWNTYGVPRERLAEAATAHGLEPRVEGPYREFGHRVDASIARDIFLAVKPGQPANRSANQDS